MTTPQKQNVEARPHHFAEALCARKTAGQRRARLTATALGIVLASSALMSPMSSWTPEGLAPRIAHADKKAEAEAVAARLAQPMAPVTAEQPADKIAIPEGTRVRLVLMDELKSNKSTAGEQVHYALAEDLKGPNGEVLIPKGTAAIGLIKKAKGAGGLGRKGKLEFTTDYIATAGDSKVTLRSSQAVDGKSRGGAVVALGLLISPLAVFMKGKNVTVARGEVVEAFVDTATTLPKTAFDNMTHHDVDSLVKINAEAKK